MIKVPQNILEKYLELLERNGIDFERIQELKTKYKTEKIGKQEFKNIIKFLKNNNNLPPQREGGPITVDDLKTIIPEGEEILHIDAGTFLTTSALTGRLTRIEWIAPIIITPKGLAYSSPNAKKYLPYYKNYIDWSAITIKKQVIKFPIIPSITMKISRIQNETKSENRERNYKFLEYCAPILKARTDYIFQTYLGKKDRKIFWKGRSIIHSVI